jgi:SAM-dependent methyltransferase
MGDRALAETQAFFAARAATWDTRFPDDAPAYARAAADLAPPRGGRVLDLGTGTGRALRPLRDQVGAGGLVVGIDVTAEMLGAARQAGRAHHGALVGADGGRLPFADGCFDAVFAAGILHHLPEPDHGLIELTRITRAGATLAVFHPISRAALAARHGGTTSDDDFLAAPNLAAQLARHGWTLSAVDDGDDRYLALAHRGLQRS